MIALFLFSGRNIPSKTNTIHTDCSILFSSRNIPSNKNTIHIYCCCVCVVFTFRPEFSVKYKYNIHVLSILTFRPEYSVQYEYNTQLLSLWLHCFYFPAGIFRPIQIQYTLIVQFYFPAGIFRPIQIQYTFIVHSHFPAGIFRPIQIQYTFIVHSHFPAGIFRPIQIQYTLIVVAFVLYQLSGRNTPSNTNTIHIYCCFVCVASTFRPEYSVQYKCNTHLLLCCISFPAGIFRSIQIQYTIIVVVIALFLFSGRNIPSNTNTIHIYCCVVLAFRPEYSVKYKYNTHLLLFCLCGIIFPAGIFRSIQIQYTFIVVLYKLSGRNIPFNTNTIHNYCRCDCIVLIFRPEYSVKYKYNTHWLLCVLHSLSGRNFPAGIFCPIQIQCTFIVSVCAVFIFLTGIFRQIQIQYKCIVVIFELYLYLRRNIPLNTNTIQYKCNLTFVL